jgi:hypothetical protein
MSDEVGTRDGGKYQGGKQQTYHWHHCRGLVKESYLRAHPMSRGGREAQALLPRPSDMTVMTATSAKCVDSGKRLP